MKYEITKDGLLEFTDNGVQVSCDRRLPPELHREQLKELLEVDDAKLMRIAARLGRVGI